jgi:MFS family permease
MAGSSQEGIKALTLSDPTNNAPWWRGLTSYHWFVFAMASLSWMFDCLDQQIFILVRKDALLQLLPTDYDVQLFGGYATSIFMIGWATGGMIFGSVGDRFGRARTLTLTVLLYSLCTGLSAFSVGWVDFAIYRFLTGLGVGGVFGLAVTLVADTLPAASRIGALGTLQALSAVGNIGAGIAMLLVTKYFAVDPKLSWKVMFLIGALPAFLCVFLQLKMKEPEAWVKAKAEGKLTGVKFGSYAELFSTPQLRYHAWLGMMLCVAGIIGMWGIGFFSPELVRDVISNNLSKGELTKEQIASQVGLLVAVNGIIQNVGAFAGMIGFTLLTQRVGRKKAFIVAFIAAFIATNVYFQSFNGAKHLWMSGLMGFCQLALFAGFAIYLPELFPLRLRSTGTSFCYNVGRYIAASGPISLGAINHSLSIQFKDDPEKKIDAFRDACSYMSVVFLMGLVVVFFMPETKGKQLPE